MSRTFRSEIERTLLDLVAIPSVNPAFPGGEGEAGVAEYIEHRLSKAGIPYTTQEVSAGRENVIGLIPGPSRGKTILFEAHMDTVQTVGMSIDPFHAGSSDGFLYGRGACDTKGSLAAMLVAMETLARQPGNIPVGVQFAAVVDEEFKYTGVSALARSIQSGETACAVVGEPTGLDRVVAHKGCVRFTVTAHGKSAHSSVPNEGTNAIEGMCETIHFLKTQIEAEYATLAHALVGPPTLCVSLIKGGEAPNSVPIECSITVDRRTVPGEEPNAVWEDIRGRLLSFATSAGISLTVAEPFVVDYAMETPDSAPFVRALGESVERVLRDITSGRLDHEIPARDIAVSLSTGTRGASYGSDASKLLRIGVPSVVFGPGNIKDAHSDSEKVSLLEVETATAALVDFIMHYQEE